MLKIHQQNSMNSENLDWDEIGYATFDAKHVIILTG